MAEPHPRRPADARPVRFRPAPGLADPHLQTIVGSVARPRGPFPVTRERVHTPDGDFLDLDAGPEPDAAGPAPVALILHGLEGSAERGYVRQVARDLLARGVRSLALNFRGCSGEPNRRTRFYHSGETSDLDFVLGVVRDRLPGRRVGLLGFSLGGNVVLKYLGEQGDRARVEAAATVSVPFDLAAGARALERGWISRIYTRRFLRSLRRKLRAKDALLGTACDLGSALSARTFREFDDAATAPLHGFEDADDYYVRSSSAHYLERIRTPTLLLQARDDPFQPAAAIPTRTIADNPWLVDGIQERGGHVGFIGGSVARPRFWAESEAARFLARALSP